MTHPTDQYRRDAKRLKKAFAAGEAEAHARTRAVLGDRATLRHADALHVIAREAGHDSWPKLKFTHEMAAMDRDARVRRLETALYFGQHGVSEALLDADPSLAESHIGVQAALHRAEAVAATLAADPGLATRPVGLANRRPLLHLAFSKWHQRPGGDPAAALPVADLLLRHGAEANDSYAYQGDPTMPLSALYGALGHGGNLPLAEWLLTHGADPNDNESLYHATELGHSEGLRLLLAHGARPEGTNALPRALDFNDHDAVALLLEAGADPDEGIAQHPSGEAPFVIPALHQAARRMCDGRMIGMLLDAGADPSARYRGLTPYVYARVYGNAEAARRIVAAGGDTALTPEETLLAAAADDRLPEGARLDPARLNRELQRLPHTLMHLPGTLPHIRRLIALGLDPDSPDDMGLTPVQIAGWEGLPGAMAFFLSQSPDLTHRNGYGGDLLSTILHGSENCPKRAERDHVACARLALESGVTLPRAEVDHGYEPEMQGFLTDWAEAHPDRKTKGEAT